MITIWCLSDYFFQLHPDQEEKDEGNEHDECSLDVVHKVIGVTGFRF